jgi:CHAT domain-containing protein
VTRLRKQIDPCTFDAASKECRDAELTFDRNAAHELYKALVGLPEILAVLNPKVIKHLMVVPSGSLTSLPPSVLIASKPDPSQQLDRSPDGWIDADWLLNRYSTSVLPAVSSLKALRAPTASGTVERDRSSPMKQLLSRVLKAAQSDSAAGSQTRAKREGRLFMLADPDFSGTGKPVKPCERIEVASARSVSSYFRDGAANRSVLAALPPLPCTRQEGEQLEGLLGGKVLYGSDARKSQLYSAENTKLLAEAEVIAFATHGLVSGSHGSGEPALALSAPLPSESDDAALLRASEIAALRLKADLVLLSACNTASPESDDASGLSGLAKAFFHAGAKAALVAHWRINDAATAAIVTEFMRLRAAGTNKADALRKASQQMLESAIAPSSLASKRVTSHPRYWAPFTLMGEPR